MQVTRCMQQTWWSLLILSSEMFAFCKILMMQLGVCSRHGVTFAFLQDPNDTETFRNFCKIVIMQLGVCSRQKGFPPEMHPVSSSGLQVKTQDFCYLFRFLSGKKEILLLETPCSLVGL